MPDFSVRLVVALLLVLLAGVLIIGLTNLTRKNPAEPILLPAAADPVPLPPELNASTSTGAGFHISYISGPETGISVNPDTGAAEMHGPAKIVMSEQVVKSLNALLSDPPQFEITLKPGETATFMPEKGQ